MSRDASYLVAYDVTDDKERSRTSKVLEGYGFRVQFSVFACRLTRSALGRMENDLRALELKTGIVGIYRLHTGSTPLLLGAVPPKRVGQPGDETAYAWII